MGRLWTNAAQRLLYRNAVDAAARSFHAGAITTRRSTHLVRAHQRRLCPIGDPAAADQHGRPLAVQLSPLGAAPSPDRPRLQPHRRPRGDAARARSAVRGWGRETGPLRLGRSGPLGPGTRRQRFQPGLRHAGLPRQPAVLGHQFQRPQPTVQPGRAGPQGDIRRRRLGHPIDQQPKPLQSAPVRLDRRRVDHPLPAIAGQLRFWHSQPGAVEIRRTQLRPALWLDGHGQQPIDRNRRQPGGHSHGRAATLANQARRRARKGSSIG